MSMSGDKPAILVTGGAGYIGSHAVLALLDAGWPVVVIDNLVTGFRWAVPEGAVFAEGDIADQDLVGRLIEEHGIRAIIHFAGSIVVPESVENPLKYYENNTVKSRSLIESAVRAESGTSSFPRPRQPTAFRSAFRSRRMRGPSRSTPMAGRS
jgi:UDP-glucose 4-epimerase